MSRQVSRNAEKIATDKPKFWEYALTASLLRDWVTPIQRRYDDLRRGLYAPTKTFIGADDFFPWASTQFENLSEQTGVLQRLVNDELGRSWGPTGQPGSVEDIKTACAYIADVCGRLLDWEETVRAARTDAVFSEVVSLLPNTAGIHIAEIMKIPEFVDRLLASGPEGSHEFTVVIRLPEQWEERYAAALERLAQNLGIDEP